MKWTLLLLLGLLSCHGRPQAGDKEWAATIADRLYKRQVLSKDGRDELQRRIAAHTLSVAYKLPGICAKTQHRAVDPATVLGFCADAFLAELTYRSGIGEETELSDLYIAGQVLDSTAKRKQRQGQQRFAAALREAHGDTLAVWRRFASPGQLLEEKIPAEDSVEHNGWTIYPPFGRGNLPRHCIADTRSIFGKTRTRTARDLYELGLLNKSDYAVVVKELAAGELNSELAVCQRAADLALDRAVYAARRAVFDSLLVKLTQAGVLTPARRQQAVADGQITKKTEPFDVLPYCTHARVFDLHALPRDPARLYPRLLAEVAALWPAFRYTAVRVVPSERDMGDLFDQQVELSFTASGRRYATTFTQGFRRKDGKDPDPATGARISKDFIAGINQWLRDQHAAERLYLAYLNITAEETDLPQYALVLLTPAQLLAWGEPGSFSGPEQLAGQFTSEHIEKTLALYKQLGLFESLPPAELAEGHRQALSGEASIYLDLLRSFPSLIIEMGGEDAEMPQAYAEMLAQVAAATRGAFRPTSVQDNFSGQQARKQKSTFSFACGPRHYHANFVSDLGWMDSGFVTLVERAVRENTKGRLYYLGEGDETSLFCFLTPTQAAALRQAQPELLAADAKEEASKQKK